MLTTKMWFESDFKHDMDIKYVATERGRRILLAERFYWRLLLLQETRGRQEKAQKIARSFKCRKAKGYLFKILRFNNL